MTKRILSFLMLLFFPIVSAFALNHELRFTLVPNIVTNYLLSVNAIQAVAFEKKAIEIVKNTLRITPESPYKTIRIRLIYNEQMQIQSMIVYLLSLQNKSMELVRINLNQDAVVAVIRDYRLRPEDLKQSPVYAHKRKAVCPDDTVQFVIGNNFNDRSVENEVQKVYQLAKDKGYHPILMDIMIPKGPQPTVQAYENWLSCPNVKGFYNESHGWEEGIVLSDDDLIYSHIDKHLKDKLKSEVILFDSCETFHNPLLSSITDKNKGDVQQYIGGFISLPFGSSERTAACIWQEAFNHHELNQKMIEVCAIKNQLQIDGFKIAGNGDNHLTPAV